MSPLYGEREAQAVVRLVLQTLFHLSVADIYSGKVSELSADERKDVDKIMRRLCDGEPVQYVLGVADFCGRAFHVNKGVLIPRVETEELCRWAVELLQKPHPNILDVGTGSGCIAVTLAKEIAEADVEAWDVAPLATAERNASDNRANVRFATQDIFSVREADELWDLIISNPPYVCEKEKADMARNVLDYEPELALFVPDAEPLKYYEAIAKYAVTALKCGGMLMFEINPTYAAKLERLLSDIGFADIEIREDMYGKKRMAKALRQ